MKKLFTIVITLLLLTSCGGRGKNTATMINPADTTNFFFSGIMDVENQTFTDCATAKCYKYDLGVEHARDISSKINKARHSDKEELYCKVKGRMIFDAAKKINVVIVENAMTLTRQLSCDKPLLPNKYLSGNTFNKSFALLINEDYTYTIELDGKEIESGVWGKTFEYQGVMIWHSITEGKKHVRSFTIDYLAHSAIITLYYDDEYIIFS